MQQHLDAILSGNPLTEQDLKTVFEAMFQGGLNDAQIAGFLCGWRLQGETYRELSVGAALMRAHAHTVPLPKMEFPLIDNCGTGGDGAHSFNISTASAIVAAACGAKVAKHGNRSVSSKCGSADLFFAAGYPDDLSPEQSSKLLANTGLTFFFAPHFHPVMKHVMPVRKALGVRTIFNLLGPLANPIAPAYQLIGVGDAKYTQPMAGALQALGTKRALVVHSRDGLDEISPAAITDAVLLGDGKLESITIDPKDFGIKGSLDELKGGDATVNLQLLMELLTGQPSTILDTVALNSAATLWIAKQAESLQEGFSLAKEALTSGKVQTFFDGWIKQAQSLRGS